MRWTENDLRAHLQKRAGKPQVQNQQIPDALKERPVSPIIDRIRLMEETIDKLRKGMYRRITLRFEFDLNTALDKAKNSKGARSYSAFKKRIENKILKQLEKEDPIPGKNVYLFDWFLPDARKDPDNVAAGKKVVFDSLCPPKRKKQKAGRKLIPNDSMRYIHSFDDQFHLDKTDPRLEITIVPA